jgi:hypothetical protein
MRKTLLVIGLVLNAGCAAYVGESQPVSPVPIYPPLYDTKPLKQSLQQSQVEALKFKRFVDDSGRMIRLQWALESYIAATKELYNEIYSAPPAQISYYPWQVQ